MAMDKMGKEEYIRQELLSITQFLLSLLLFPVGVITILLLSLLDYFVTPENFTKFLIYRIITASLITGLYFVLRLKKNGLLQSIIAVTGSLTIATMVELMILSFGGHQSPYYAGMIIVVVFILGFVPLSLRTTALAFSLVYATYFVPILLFDHISNLRVFINNNIFLVSFVLGGFAWRYYNNELLHKKLSLEYDLAQDKEKLAQYSTQLEHLVSERTRELNKSNVMLNSLFENANDGIVIMNRDGIILDVNQKACDLHGFEKDALIGVNIGLLETEENKQIFRERKERILNGEAMLFETQHYKKDGSRVSLEISAKAIEVEGKLLIQSFHRDITDRKRLQEQLFQSQKMESIGVLAGGIAHDFNNILSAVLGHAELLLEFGNLDEQANQRVRIIESSARKAGQMISRLLSFARKGSFDSVPVNLNEVIRDTTELLGRMMTKKGVAIALGVDNALPPVNGDANQLEQVIMNLVVNAGDAMPNGGTVTITTSLSDLQKDPALVHPLLAPGKYVTLKVADTGTGIPEEIRDRIFDPFFTTKQTGKGTGLGLAMVYGIVKEHGGAINVASRPGKGTTFEIYLPASDMAVPMMERPSVYAMTGREKILVVDDEQDILSFIKDVLETQGYKVLVTDNPVNALDMFRKVSDDIDLVITDIVMPLVNGGELIRQVKTLRPSIRVIAISGYDTWTMGKRDRDIDAYITKPFQGVYLLSIVRRVLDARGSTHLTRHLPL